MPLTFDIPLEELYSYEGRNPRPADHGSYWDDALAEMRTVEPDVVLESADFQTTFADGYHLWFTGVRGARIHVQILKPRTPSDKPHPAILMFHGYTGNAGSWLDKLGYVAQGFTVAAMDCRGQGGLSEDTGGVKGPTINGHIIRGLSDDPQNMLMRHIFLDTAQLARIVMAMPDVDENRVGTLGASQGGALALVCAALEPRIQLTAPVYPFLCDYQRVWEIDLTENAYGELRDYFRHHDPRHERQAEIFTQLGYIDVQHLAPRIQARVMMAVGLMDKICPPSTQFAAYNKITSSKSLVLYPDFGHEDLPGLNDSIFQWMQML